jgi:hypothetical protein
MDNPETLTTLGTQGTGQINVIENRMENTGVFIMRTLAGTKFYWS